MSAKYDYKRICRRVRSNKYFTQDVLGPLKEFSESMGVICMAAQAIANDKEPKTDEESATIQEIVRITNRIDTTVFEAVLKLDEIKDDFIAANKLLAQVKDYCVRASSKIPDEEVLAVKKEVCPFPNDCNLVSCCTKDSCSADVCQNGHAFRWS